MISPHLKTIMQLLAIINDIEDMAETMPDSREKFILQERAYQMCLTAEQYFNDSLSLYDKLMAFTMRVAL